MNWIYEQLDQPVWNSQWSTAKCINFWSPLQGASMCMCPGNRAVTYAERFPGRGCVCGWVHSSWGREWRVNDKSHALCGSRAWDRMGLRETRERGNKNQELSSWIAHHFYINTQLPVQIYIYTSVLSNPHLFPVMIIEWIINHYFSIH